jgi:hypothetical protein
MQFDGSTTRGTINRMIQDDFTIEAWIKTSTTSLTGTMFFQGNPLIYADMPNMANDFGTNVVSNHFALGVGNPDTTVVGTSTITSGQWVHVAATRTKATGVLIVIVNGTQDGTVTSTNLNSLTAPPTISLGGNTLDNRWYTGQMDELRIWNTVRTPQTISANMHSRLTGNEAGLVGYWRFDEGNGVSALDATAGHNDATFTGNVVWVASTAPITTCP